MGITDGPVGDLVGDIEGIFAEEGACVGKVAGFVDDEEEGITVGETYAGEGLTVG